MNNLAHAIESAAQIRFSVERNVLVHALNRCGSIVESKTSIPILSHILIEATVDGTLKLTATDLDIAIYEELPGNVDQPGSIAVPAGVLSDIVKKCPESAVIDIFQTPGAPQVELWYGKSKFALSCLPATDFPSIASQDLPHKYGFDAPSLKRLFDVTHIAMGHEETRPNLNGVFFEVYGDGCARGVATDGHRLSLYNLGNPQGEPAIGVIVHSKTVSQIRKMTQDIDTQIRVELSEGQIRFSYGNTVLISRLVDADYVDYRRVIPDTPVFEITPPTKDFMNAVDRVSILAHDKMNLVKLSLERNSLLLSAISQEYGSAQEDMEIEYAGDPFVFAFNARYIREFGDKTLGKSITLAFTDEGSAACLKDPEDQDLLYVMMPVAI